MTDLAFNTKRGVGFRDATAVLVRRIESPFALPDLECRECLNPLGEPWHHHRTRRCFFGDAPRWRRVLRRLARR